MMMKFSRFAVACNQLQKSLHPTPRNVEYKPVLPTIQVSKPTFYESKMQFMQLWYEPVRIYGTIAGTDDEDDRDAMPEPDYEPDDDEKNEPYLNELDKLRNGRKAMDVATKFEAWREQGFRPNLRVFERLLTALLAGGNKKDFKSAYKYLIEMADKFYFEQSRVEGNFKYVLFYCSESRKKAIINKLKIEAKKRNLKV